jgi:CRP-like cAMP-binding protein
VRISKFIPNIGEEALAVLKPGDYFGEMALIDNFPRSAHAIANTDLDVLAITKTDLDKVLIRDREMGYKLLWTFTRTLSKRLRETNEKMAGFLAMSGGF